ncbi:MAG: PQQ-binding-like beta-propeller repeat protein, partial [Clostridia bacterium]
MTVKTKKIIFITVGILLILCLIASVCAGIYFGVKTVECEGFVLESVSKNPIANVAVTDGKNVVKTDESGHFKLKGWHKARFVTITNPTGYWTEKYYLEISKKIKRYDFELDKVETSQTNHNFVHISDTEVGKNGVGEWINDVKNVVEQQKPAFIIQTGDICYADGLKSHIKGMNSENMGVPVRYAMGNHDFVGGSDGDYGEELFEDIYGPVCYSFDVGEIHYIVTPMMTYTETPAKYSKNDVWRWVENDLKNKEPNKKVVMFNHDYCEDENGFEIKRGSNTLKLKENGLIAWIFGHWHYNFVNNVDGVFNICTAKPDLGGVDNSPNAVRDVCVNADKIVSANLYYGYKISAEANSNFLWRAQLDGRVMFAEPIIQQNFAYIAMATDSYPSKSGITCIDLLSGKTVWQYDTINSVRNSFAVSGNYVVCQDVEGRVYCLDKSSGALLWQTDCVLLNPKNTSKGVVVENDFVYCGSEEKITCLNIANGSVCWAENRAGNSSSASRFVVYKNFLIVGSHWDRVVCYDKTTGKKLWESQNKVFFVTSTPYCYDDKVVVASNENIFEYNINNGKITQEKKL